MNTTNRNGTPQASTVARHTPSWPSVELDPKDLIPAPGNLPATMQGITESGLLESVNVTGQLVEIIVYSHADLPPGKFYIADGNGRTLCAFLLRRTVKAHILDHAPTKSELRRMRVATFHIRKDKSAAQAQLAADLSEEMEETGHTQEQASTDLGITASHASKVLAPLKKLSAGLQHLRENKSICWDGLRIIATMPTEELQKELADKVLGAINVSGRVKRDVIERWAKELKGEKLPKKERSVKVSHGGVLATVKGNPIESLRAFIAKANEAIRRLEKDKLPQSVLPEFFRT